MHTRWCAVLAEGGEKPDGNAMQWTRDEGGITARSSGLQKQQRPVSDNPQLQGTVHVPSGTRWRQPSRGSIGGRGQGHTCG